MPATKISIDEAKKDKLFYFVANALVYREEDGRCLLLKRSHTEKVHPGRWATPGGKMEWQDFDLSNPTRLNGDVLDYLDSVEGLLKREIMEEAGVEVKDDFKFINSNTFIRPDGIPVVLIKLAVSYRSGDVVLEEGCFDDFAWVNEEEVKALECIDGICEEVVKTVSLYKK
ncbi:MAG: NUDIX hydrolase [Patescibacteria group bacterium UBA2103]